MNSSFTTTQIIAKEGWRNIAIASALFFIALASDFGEVVMLFVLLILIFIYRNPERIASEDDPLAILSPIDGKIIAIDRGESELLGGEKCLHIKIRSLPFDVSMVRFPILAVLTNAKTIHGLFLPPYKEEAALLNEHIDMRCALGDLPFAMRLRAGMFSRKIYLAKSRGNVRAGSRIAFMVDGTVELFLPLTSRIKLSLGDHVRGGESVIGYFAYKG